MTADERERRGVAAEVGRSARAWAPYVALAVLVAAASAVSGALSGPGASSAFVPTADARDTMGAVLYLVSVSAVMVVGGVFVGLPTVALLALQGRMFGSALAGLAAEVGTEAALAMAWPAAAVALTALVFVAAIPLRGLHYAARMIRETPPPSVPSRRFVGEAVLLGVLAVLGFVLAATLATGATTG